MIEQVFEWTQGDAKTIEKVIVNTHLHYMHVILPQGEGLPLHQSNANVYMTVLRGHLSIGLDDQEVHRYGPATVLAIPFDTKMNVRNEDFEPLEFTIVKTPAPGDYYQK